MQVGDELALANLVYSLSYPTATLSIWIYQRWLSEPKVNIDVWNVYYRLRDFDMVVEHLSGLMKERYKEALKDVLFEPEGADLLWEKLPPIVADALDELDSFRRFLERQPENLPLFSTKQYQNMAAMAAQRHVSQAVLQLVTQSDPEETKKSMKWVKSAWTAIAQSPGQKALVQLKNRCDLLLSRILPWQNTFALVVGQMYDRLLHLDIIKNGEISAANAAGIQWCKAQIETQILNATLAKEEAANQLIAYKTICEALEHHHLTPEQVEVIAGLARVEKTNFVLSEVDVQDTTQSNTHHIARAATTSAGQSQPESSTRAASRSFPTGPQLHQDLAPATNLSQEPERLPYYRPTIIGPPPDVRSPSTSKPSSNGRPPSSDRPPSTGGQSSTQGSTVGPKPPANVDRLPPSVQARYRSYNPPEAFPNPPPKKASNESLQTNWTRASSNEAEDPLIRKQMAAQIWNVPPSPGSSKAQKSSYQRNKFWEAVYAFDITDIMSRIRAKKLKDVSVRRLGETALTFAAQAAPLDSDSANMLIFLLLKTGPGVDVNAVSDISKRAPLHWVAYHNKLDVVQDLVESGANLNALDAQGMTPAILAASTGNLEMVNVLLSYPGADAMLEDNNKLTVHDHLVIAAQASMYGGPLGTSSHPAELP